MSGSAAYCWLVVEDDENDFLLFRRACKKALSRLPHIHWVKDGAAAKAFLASANPKPCLVISDIKMPRITGLELLRWIRAQESLDGICFVILSNSNLAGDFAQAKASGADDFRTKPSEYNQLPEIIRRWAALTKCRGQLVCLEH